MADFKAIETFMWVVTLGSFRGAAQKLNTTQPAISQRIAQLEREVGVKLLQRDRRMNGRSRAVWCIIPLTALLANVHLYVIFAPLAVATALLAAAW